MRPMQRDAAAQTSGSRIRMTTHGTLPRFRPGADSRFLFHCCGAYMATHNSNFINAAPLIYRKKGGAFSLLREKDIPLMGER